MANTKKNFPTKLRLALFRVVQELINNALKHADAKTIDLQLSFMPNSLKIVVQDNGKGFDMNSVEHKKSGLKNIESRMSIINGKIEFNSELGVGTKATVVLENQLSTRIIERRNIRKIKYKNSFKNEYNIRGNCR